MSLFLQIIQRAEINEILDYESQKAKEQFADESERMFQSWAAPWRQESLEHYLSMGWSFVARDPEQVSPHSAAGLLVGYFIAQPLLFFAGQTQSLWVEHLQYSSLQARDELCELAYRLSREKHFQKVFFPQTPTLGPLLKSMKAEEWGPNVMFINTTRTAI